MLDSLELDTIDSGIDPYNEEENRLEYRFLAKEREGMEIPCLVRIRKELSDAPLLVTFNGAIQRSKAPDGVVFQRSSWLDEIEANVIQIADPTLRKFSNLQIGWGQFSKETWAMDSYTRLVNVLRDVFDFAAAERTLFYGSSAGGFQAIATATLSKGGRVLVNNPQLDWSQYLPPFVQALVRNVFDGIELEQLRAEHPWRVNVFELCRRENYVPDTEILVNLSSQQDFQNQLLPSVTALAEGDLAGKTPKVCYKVYADPAFGHNPLNKPFTIKKLNEILSSRA